MNEFPMNKDELIKHSIIPTNGPVDELLMKATWQNRVRKTRQKLTDLLFEIRERGNPYGDEVMEVMGLPIIDTIMFLQSKIHPNNLHIYPRNVQVFMLSDAGVHWCNLVYGVITGKFDDRLFREVKK